MAAVPIYVWNGTAWQETGPTIPANPIKYQASAPSSPSTGDIWVDSDGDVTTGSQQFQRFRFVASGGETTISGADANGAVLAYTAGLEQVVLNGAVLVRGHDYTATTGTTITGLSPALVASDVLEVFSFIAFTVANTYTQSQVDGLVTSANDAIGMKLIVPSSVTGGTASSTGAVSFSSTSSVSLNGVFSSTYQNYRMIINFTGASTQLSVSARMRVGGVSNSTASSYLQQGFSSISTTLSNVGLSSTSFDLGEVNATYPKYSSVTVDILSPFETDPTRWNNLLIGRVNSANAYATGNYSGVHTQATSYDGVEIYPSTGTVSGTVRVYGYKN
jgi:hypothetical protein